MEPDRPSTILADDPLMPRAPWTFLRPALPGGFTRWGWGLGVGWLLVLLGPALGWAGHLRRAAGSSALPSHWGESLTVRDLWELWENGGLQHRLTNSPTVHLFAVGLIIVLWCGWRMQAETAGQKARLGPWLLGALDTLLIGFLPILTAAWVIDRALAWAGASGLEGLGWAAFFGRPLLWMATLGTLNLQWWFCRLGRSAGLSRGYRAHLGDCFKCLWSHPIQWSGLTLGGAACRSLPPFLVLLLAWRLGGGTPFRVWLFLLLQLTVTAINAWLLGWLLRSAARFWNHDAAVRDARAALKEPPRDAEAS